MIVTCTCGVYGDELSDLRKDVDSLKKEVAELNVMVFGTNKVASLPPNALSRGIGTTRDEAPRVPPPLPVLDSEPLRMMPAQRVINVTDSTFSEIPKGSDFKTDGGVDPYAYFSGFQLGVTSSRDISRTSDIGKRINKCRISLFVQTDRVRGDHWYSESVDPKAEYGTWDDFTYPVRLTNGKNFVEVAKPTLVTDKPSGK